MGMGFLYMDCMYNKFINQEYLVVLPVGLLMI
jgi:hypothetical protein